jgi:phosphoribosyl 1,2-cyclic phosphate phosphodiesterase
MNVTFLGTGTSQGVPVIACECEVCRSLDYRDKRLRVSVHLEVNNKSFIIDAGPDFRQQVLRERIKNLDALILTHEHKDHIAGLDDVRAYNFRQRRDMPIYGLARTLAQVRNEFYYAFEEVKYPGVPLIQLHEISNQPFDIEGVTFVPIEVMHHKLSVLGFRVGDFCYITDANFIADAELDKIKGSKVVVLNALQKDPHISHYTLKQAIEVLENIAPQQAYLTHLSHKMGLHAEVEPDLPSFIKIAYDGLRLKI